VNSEPRKKPVGEDIAKLLAIGRNAETAAGGEPGEREAERALSGLLSSPPPAEWLETAPLDGHPLPPGRPLREVLTDGSLSVAAARIIKEEIKRRFRSHDETKAVHDASVAAYLAAIANALVFHGEKISSYSYRDLGGAFARMAEKPWMEPELVPLFLRARDVCKNKMNRKA